MSSEERGLRIENIGTSRHAGAPARSSLLAPRSCRSGFTLVELLITIMIIGILAAMILGVAAVAGNTAREAKTRNMIARLHTLLMQQADTYKTRRVKVKSTTLDIINGLPGAKRGESLATLRLYALREMMLMEMPDRWSDVLLAAVPSSPTGVNDAANPTYLEGRTDLENIYLRRYDRLTIADQ